MVAKLTDDVNGFNIAYIGISYCIITVKSVIQ